MKPNLLYIIVLYLLCLKTYAQKEESTFYNFYDSIVELKNTDLSYGMLFKEKYNSSSVNHYFFLSNKPLPGNIDYNNKVFFTSKMKLDLIQDNLILYISDNDNSSNYPLILNSSYVNKFTLSGHIFLNDPIYKYVEKLAENKNHLLFKKHLKKEKKQLDRRYLYYKYNKTSKLYLQKDSTYLEIKKVKDFYNAYPNKKKIIKAFIKKNNYLFKENKEIFFTKLFTSLNIN